MTMAAPNWLRGLVNSSQFFTPCGKCSHSHTAREATLNYWDLEQEQELCSICLLDPTPREVLQVRRSSYHDVVKVADVSRLADISGIQSYVINGSKVVFLRRRPQQRPPKGALGASQCTICSRHLQDVSAYCSLQCKLDSASGIKHVSLRSLGSMDDSGSSRSGTGPDTPSHLSALKPLSLPDAGSESDSGADSQLSKRRKGLPYRSPME